MTKQSTLWAIYNKAGEIVEGPGTFEEMSLSLDGYANRHDLHVARYTGEHEGAVR